MKIEIQKRIFATKQTRKTADDKQKIRAEYDLYRDKKEEKLLGGFKKIYPSADRDLDKFNAFMKVAKVIWEEFTGSKPKPEKLDETETQK
jgi:hypothetical protein